jgi:uncharacterized protein YkwD
MARRRARSRASSCVLLLGALALACGTDDDDDSAGAGSQAGRSGVSDSPDARVYVDAHNAVRAAVQKPANYSGTWTAVPPVTWSDAVATTAQDWAENLRDSMDCGLMHASGTGYGENLAAGSNVDAARAVEMWASEIKNYTYSPQYSFENDTGHYTQIVWRKTTQIGCGRATCGNRAVVACRYSPPGNYIGQAPY